LGSATTHKVHATLVLSALFACGIATAVGIEVFSPPRKLVGCHAEVLKAALLPDTPTYLDQKAKIEDAEIDLRIVLDEANGKPIQHGEFALVQMPGQDVITLRQARASDGHLTQTHGRVTVEKGFVYAFSLNRLPTEARGPSVSAVLARTNSVQVNLADGPLQGDVLLISPKDLETAQTLLQPQQAARDPLPFSRTTFTCAPAYQDGVVCTGRGTMYVFSGGKVKVIPRGGESREISLSSSQAYASHLEILRRQGVDRSLLEGASPQRELEVALQTTQDKLNLLNDEDPSLKALMLKTNAWLSRLIVEFRAPLQAELEENNLKLGLGPHYSKYSAMTDALRAGDELNAGLPESLKWQTYELREKASVPVEDGRAVKTTQMVKFLFFRGPGKNQTKQLRFLTDMETLHIQGAYAHLGNMALELDKDNLMGGGIVQLRYHPESGKMISAEIIDTSSVSLYRTEKSTLTPEEHRKVLMTLKSTLPWDAEYK
jgi:hypothetical protein